MGMNQEPQRAKTQVVVLLQLAIASSQLVLNIITLSLSPRGPAGSPAASSRKPTQAERCVTPSRLADRERAPSPCTGSECPAIRSRGFQMPARLPHAANPLRGCAATA